MDSDIVMMEQKDQYDPTLVALWSDNVNLNDCLSLIADPKERAFREELFTLAKAQDFKAWNQTRLIFADYLADRDDPEEEAVRADWKCIAILLSPSRLGRQGVPWCFKLHVPIIYEENRVAIGRFNAKWLLGFTPGSLLIRSAQSRQVIRLTWCPNRDRRGIKSHEGQGDVTKKRPLGYVGMWYKPGVSVGRKEPSLFDAMEANDDLRVRKFPCV